MSKESDPEMIKTIIEYFNENWDQYHDRHVLKDDAKHANRGIEFSKNNVETFREAIKRFGTPQKTKYAYPWFLSVHPEHQEEAYNYEYPYK